MVNRYVPGNEPTELDYLNAQKYAFNKIYKEMCEDNPSLYKWKDFQSVYFCPTGLTCPEGKPTFTKQGCISESKQSYLDCERDENGLCNYKKEFTWDIPKSSDDPSQLAGTLIKPQGKCSKDKTKVCSNDKDCGDGDKCMISSPPYLEWYDEDIKIGNNTYEGDKCYWVLDQYKRWCEMPWTRTDSKTNPPKASAKKMDIPPFHYDASKGSCKTTKTYCNNFFQEFGKPKDYVLFQNCTNKTSNIIDDSKDCCTNLGDSIGQFFLGKTIEDCIAHPSKCNDKIFDFYCDKQLKKNIKLIKEDFLPDLNIYMFEWNKVAETMYGLKGKSIGFMSSEVKKKFPKYVLVDKNGYEYVKYSPQKCNSDKDFKKLCIFIHNTKFINNLLYNLL